VIAAALVVIGAIMIAAERRCHLHRSIRDLLWADALIIGMAQSLALVPGVSRSGATIVAALFLGIRRSDAARFSFLLGIPAVAGAGLYELKDALDSLGHEAWGPILIGCAAAAVSGYAAIAWLLRFLSRHELTAFGVYRIGLGLALVGLCAGGVLFP